MTIHLQNHVLETNIQRSYKHLKNSPHQECKEYLPCDKEPSDLTEVWRGSHVCFNMRHGIAAARCLG